MQIVVLAGGVGGSKFVQGVRRGYPEADLTVVGNTADDITLHGLRICPDLDTMMYTLGGAGDDERGWGRLNESWRVLGELAGYGVEPSWFSIGDLDLGTHLVRTQLLDAGYALTEVTQALASRWLGADSRLRLLPMSDDRVETHIVIPAPDSPSGRRAVHFQEYWVRLHAVPEALEVVRVGIEDARPTTAVLTALAQADLVLIAPSNPVVSIGPILAVPGLAAAVRATPAPVVGFAGILGGAPVLGMAHRLLPAIGVEVDAAAVGLHYGPRSASGVLDLWVMDDRDAGSAPRVAGAGLAVTTADLVMRDADATARFVRDALERLPTGSAPAA
ncbi:MAG: Lactyl (2) diphospho-(5')guanosine:7,8-didemethyl-8-hydroxy-5-deazariboflavin 2-phospho-L-lactate transferase [uncultured Friedmanniella sp.]|uniref:Lactyl (2) diphospho-(5')guanosine:7,8-didemethyl-8-hydroxy-5-deazarib oflavin 2-phospho-L-lactate transferase n=1 Tax=uncultured Friedmanniella sp. TaxID=335381 RepID=A0A6J4L722_9ACTN|nr:2-phospho-L-lactate transferase [uncultured Friedmanniella sp.]CAA9325624.1 MAG: Lactyl (2) diphospho-(5')guanosine:7,8-didemethyl-8-hydroxy-5-deazariboflavin 2-phospho-L-lactate transferase [uncultured Friedmanniella sp.]